MNDKVLLQYAEQHSDIESPLLAELTRETNIRIYHPRMLSGHIQGRFLSMISKMIQPQRILEIGTYTGYSALCLAEGLSFGGKLYTIEINDELEDFIRSYFNRSDYKDVIILKIGDAREIIPLIDESFDLVYIDGDKREYADYYHLVFDKVKPGGFIIADNVFWNGKVVDELQNDEFTSNIRKFNELIAHDNRVEKVILPIRDGLSIIRKK